MLTVWAIGIVWCIIQLWICRPTISYTTIIRNILHIYKIMENVR